MSVFGVILVRIFLYSDWIRRGIPYPVLFLSAFSCIRTGYGEVLRVSLYSVQMQENADKNNSKYGHFFRSVKYFKFSDQASLVTCKSSSYSSLIHVLMNQNFKHNRQHLPSDSVWKKFPYMKNKGFFYFLFFD